MTAVIISRHPSIADSFLSTIDGRLSGQSFSVYGQGVRFDAANKGRVVPAARLAAYIKSLNDNGIRVVAPAEVVEAAKNPAAPATPVVVLGDKLEYVRNAIAACGRSFFPYQEAGIRWLGQRQSAVMADEMGLGKTLQVLAAATDRVVVVCPSAARGSWEREIRMARPDLVPVQLSGLGSFRWPSANEAVILTYDVLPPTKEQIAAEKTRCVGEPASEAPTGVTVIADEAHALKGSVTKTVRVQRFRVVQHLAKVAGGRVYLLTATPLLNRPLELWNIYASAGIATETFGPFDAFAYNAGGEKGRWGWEWFPAHFNHTLIADQMRKTTIRRTKAEVLPDLPEQTHTWMPVSIRDSLDALELSELISAEQAEVLTSTGLPSFEQTSAARAILAKAKIPAMLEVVEQFEEQTEPLVVFSAHVAPIAELAKRTGWATITGETSPARRTEIVEAFQAGRLKGVGITIQAGGVAITMTRASNALFVDSSWTPALDDQACARIHRIGQKNACQYIHLMADSLLDAHVQRVHGTKREFASVVDTAAFSKDAVLPSPEPATEPATEAPAGELRIESMEEFQDAQKRREEAEKAAAEGRRIERAKRRMAERKAYHVDYIARQTGTTRRPAATEAESRAIAGLARLAEADADFAKEDNGIGFSKATTGEGHRLVWAAEATNDHLTDDEWAMALEIAHTHRKQLAR